MQAPELYDTAKLLADKDREIEELRKDREELLEKQQHWQHHHPTRSNSALLFLPYKLAMEIYDNITGAAAAAASATTAIAGFDIEYDGEQVTVSMQYVLILLALESPLLESRL